MKIVHVIAHVDPAYGGPSQVVVRNAAIQANMGHDVHVVAYLPAEAELRFAKLLARTPYADQFRCHLLPKPGVMELLFARQARRMLDAVLADTDWVHIHGVWETIISTAAQMAYDRGIPYCYRPAGMLDPWSLSQKPLKKKLALMLGRKRALNRAAFIHVLNKDEGRLLRPLRLNTPAEVIPNGIFAEELRNMPQQGAFYAAHPELAGRPYVLFLSRLHFKKGLDILAGSFAKLAAANPEVQLVVAGPEEGAGDDFRRRIAQAGLADRVHMVGALYGKAKFAAIQDAAVYCLPSRQEGFPVAVVETLACGTPVVISPDCHFAEVEDVGAGHVVGLDPVAIASALQDVLGLPASQRQAMGQRARKLIEDHYLYSRIADDTFAAYHRAISRQRSARAAAVRPIPAYADPAVAAVGAH